MIEALQRGPIAVAFQVYSDFMRYRGGIYKHTGLHSRFSPFHLTDHAVLLVGYGELPEATLVPVCASWNVFSCRAAENRGQIGFWVCPSGKCAVFISRPRGCLSHPAVVVVVVVVIVDTRGDHPCVNVSPTCQSTLTQTLLQKYSPSKLMR